MSDDDDDDVGEKKTSQVLPNVESIIKHCTPFSEYEYIVTYPVPEFHSLSVHYSELFFCHYCFMKKIYGGGVCVVNVSVPLRKEHIRHMREKNE